MPTPLELRVASVIALLEIDIFAYSSITAARCPLNHSSCLSYLNGSYIHCCNLYMCAITINKVDAK